MLLQDHDGVNYGRDKNIPDVLCYKIPAFWYNACYK